MPRAVDSSPELADFRSEVRDWCRRNIPSDWRREQMGANDEQFVNFQKAWFQTLRSGGFAVPHWPREWGGGLAVTKQTILFQELAAHDAPRVILSFMAIHHAAATLLEAGTPEQQARHLPAILDGEVWAQGFSEPEAGSDLASLRTRAVRDGDHYVVNGQKLWASGAAHADWCLLLVRTDADAPKRRGISFLLMDMRTPGVEVRPIKQATGESHFSEMFLSDVRIPIEQLVGAENSGWQIAQTTLGAERGMVMLELAERLGISGFRWLVDTCRQPRGSGQLINDSLVRNRLVELEIRITGLRAMCQELVDSYERGDAGPADASIVKLTYSELLQDLMNFGSEVAGLDAMSVLRKPRSSGWESGAWVLDFIGSWEWTIPAGTSEIQRNIIGERGLGLPREPQVGP